jgi:predicted anti-sigma-YlaC factor YlaD
MLDSRACDRARHWVSLELDDELSELESARLSAHVEGCAACRAFEADTRALTQRLRSAPLEALGVPIALPVRRRMSRLVSVGVGSATALAASVAVVLGTVGSSPVNRPPAALTVVGTGFEDIQAVREARRAELRQPSPVLLLVRRGLAAPGAV